MIIDLSYNPEWDKIDRNELGEFYYSVLALSCAADISLGVTSHVDQVNNVIKNYPKLSNEEIWYITLIIYLRIRTKLLDNIYANSYLNNLYTYCLNKEFPEEIIRIISSINLIIPDEGLFFNISESIEDEDPILNQIVQLKEELRKSIGKYFRFKNTQPELLKRTLNTKYTNSKYIDDFDTLFNIYLICCMPAIEELFEQGLQNNELAVRAKIFGYTEVFIDNTFIKHKAELKSAICNELSKYELAIPTN